MVSSHCFVSNSSSRERCAQCCAQRCARPPGIRIFGGAGSFSTLQQFVGAFNWGHDLNNNTVSSYAAWSAAVAGLRAPAGHTPASAGSFANPVKFSALDLMLNSSINSPTGGSLLSTVQGAQALGIEPLIVDWMPCTVFAFSTLNTANGTYWAEHWELYKHQARAGWPPTLLPPPPFLTLPLFHPVPPGPTPCSAQYAMARWAFVHGVRKLEMWNEPDLSASCITNASWVEHFTLQTQAIQNAFADLNADVAAGTIPCPVAACPFQAPPPPRAAHAAPLGPSSRSPPNL